MFPIASGTACRQRDNRAADCGITVGPDGALWFTQSQGRKVGRITTDGQLTEFPVNGGLLGLDTIATGSDGNLWVTDFFRDRVFRVAPPGGVTPVQACRAPDRITNGPDGNLWMVCFQSLGRLTTSGVSSTYPVASPLPEYNAGAVDITAAPDGNLWYAMSTFRGLDGTQGPFGIGRVNPSTGPNGYALAPENGRPLAMAMRQSTGTTGANGSGMRFVYAITDGANDLLYDVDVAGALAADAVDLTVEVRDRFETRGDPCGRFTQKETFSIRLVNLSKETYSKGTVDFSATFPLDVKIERLVAFVPGTTCSHNRSVVRCTTPQPIPSPLFPFGKPETYAFVDVVLPRPAGGGDHIVIPITASVSGGGDSNSTNNAFVDRFRVFIDRSGHIVKVLTDVLPTLSELNR
jgi:streptogramin lyase